VKTGNALEEILPHFTMVEGAEPFRYCYMWQEGGGGKRVPLVPYLHCIAKKSVGMI